MKTKSSAKRPIPCPLVLAVITAAFFTSLAPQAFSQQMYSITDLGNLGGGYSIAQAINNNGQVVGYSQLRMPSSTAAARC